MPLNYAMRPRDLLQHVRQFVRQFVNILSSTATRRSTLLRRSAWSPRMVTAKIELNSYLRGMIFTAIRLLHSVVERHIVN